MSGTGPRSFDAACRILASRRRKWRKTEKKRQKRARKAEEGAGRRPILAGQVLVSSTLDLDELGYEGSVTKSLMIGGCNSSRCSMVGAVVAAMQGGDTIPAAWIEATNRGADFVAASEKIA